MGRKSRKKTVLIFKPNRIHLRKNISKLSGMLIVKSPSETAPPFLSSVKEKRAQICSLLHMLDPTPPELWCCSTFITHAGVPLCTERLLRVTCLSQCTLLFRDPRRGDHGQAVWTTKKKSILIC